VQLGRRHHADAAEYARLDYPVGSFSLTERSGKTITDKDLRDKVWVASFVFTRCTGPCPAVTGTVSQLQSELAGEADVRFVTFTWTRPATTRTN